MGVLGLPGLALGLFLGLCEPPFRCGDPCNLIERDGR